MKEKGMSDGKSTKELGGLDKGDKIRVVGSEFWFPPTFQAGS